MTTTKITPVFNQTYFWGYIGFTRTFDTVGDAIAYGERNELVADFPSVNHAFVVTGDNECVQAHIDNGVQCGKISDYLNDPRSRVYFREPCLWTPDLGQQIAERAISKIGCKYAKELIIEQALDDTIVGQELNRLFDDVPHETLDALIGKAFPSHMDCSGLASWALSAFYPGYRLFAKGTAQIDPQTLLEFGPFKPFVWQALS